MKQTIEIEVPDGKKAIWKDGKVVFEDAERQLPKTWEEFCDQNKIKEGESFINDCCYIREANPYKRHGSYDRNILPSKQAAEQHLALMQLHQLRDCYRQGWVPDWENYKSDKYCVISTDTNCAINLNQSLCRFLAFQSKEIAGEFLTNFRDLIEQVKDLI